MLGGAASNALILREPGRLPSVHKPVQVADVGTGKVADESDIAGGQRNILELAQAIVTHDLEGVRAARHRSRSKAPVERQQAQQQNCETAPTPAIETDRLPLLQDVATCSTPARSMLWRKRAAIERSERPVCPGRECTPKGESEGSWRCQKPTPRTQASWPASPINSRNRRNPGEKLRERCCRRR